MNFQKIPILIGLMLFLSCATSTTTSQDEKSKYRALIIDGENNHGIWPMTTVMMKDYLEQTSLFSVDVIRTMNTWQGPHYDKSIGLDDITELINRYPIAGMKKTTSVEEPVPDSSFDPDFDQYDVVITNFGWKASNWSKAVKSKFENYMSNGGGLVVIHAANNSWGDWDEYNKMIGLGGWGGRSTASGPYVYFNDNDELIRDPSEGDCGSHGPQHEYVVTTRNSSHPIMKGLPKEWLHTKDELYDRLRGPAQNLTVLATAYSDVEKNGPPWNKKVNGSGRHEPMLFTVDYGKGRVFHTAMGHMDYSMECVGFITTFQRGSEWAATGKVTQDVPTDFPKAGEISKRSWVYNP